MHTALGQNASTRMSTSILHNKVQGKLFLVICLPPTFTMQIVFIELSTKDFHHAPEQIASASLSTMNLPHVLEQIAFAWWSRMDHEALE